MSPMHPEAVYEEENPDQPVSLSRYAHVLRRYSHVIALTIAVILLLYAIIAVIIYLLAPMQKVVSLPFRLQFNGATIGQYPNGLKFGANEITSTPIMLEVFSANALARFTSFSDFSNSVFVVESNQALEQLNREYDARLSDPKLTPIDRDRLEREFESKRAAFSKSDYAVEYLVRSRSNDVPVSVIEKALADILASWARHAAIDKKVLEYEIDVVGPSILDTITISGNNYLIPLLLLRQRVDTVISNASAVADIPGARLVRIRGTKTSIAEVQLRLGEIIRFQLEPLIDTARAAGLFGPDAVEVMRAQLAYDQRMLTSAQMRQTALQNTLLTYQAEQPQPATTSTSQTSATRSEHGNGETLIPQISDTFLDRLVDLTTRNADRDYRQKLTNEIKEASLAVVPIEAAVKYDQELIDSFRNGTATGGTAAHYLKTQWDIAIAEIRDAIVDLDQIYNLASKQLYPETEMYRITGPPTTHVDRTLSPARLALYGLVVFLIALPITIGFVLIHDRIRQEEAAEGEKRAVHEAAASA